VSDEKIEIWCGMKMDRPSDNRFKIPRDMVEFCPFCKEPIGIYLPELNPFKELLEGETIQSTMWGFGIAFFGIVFAERTLKALKENGVSIEIVDEEV